MTKSPPAPETRTSRRIILSTIILALAVLYKLYIHNILTLGLGIGRVVQPITDFPAFNCQKLETPLLHGCEDIWLDGPGRKLYAACGDVQGRKSWCPGGGKLNATGRVGTNWVSVLDVDQPGEDGLFGVRRVEVGGGFDGALDLHGFDVKEVEDGVLRFWLINHRPPMNWSTGEMLDASAEGANSTIEVFDLDKKRETPVLEHVKTIVSDAVLTPNNLAVEDDGIGFLITNDHTRKSGALKRFEIIMGGGSIAYCRTDSGECRIVDDKGFHGPNGIAKGDDGLFYVVNAGGGKISVHELVDGQLRRVNEIDTGFPMDNLSVDSEGNIIAAAFPEVLSVLTGFDNPETVNVASTVLKIRKTDEVDGQARYEVEKMIEDNEGKMLSVTTVSAYDTQSHQLFVGGILTPFMTVCKNRA